MRKTQVLVFVMLRIYSGHVNFLSPLLVPLLLPTSLNADVEGIMVIVLTCAESFTTPFGC